MQLHRITQVTNPETFEPMTIETWRRWQEDKPDYWVDKTWTPSWELFAMSPNTQFELELN
jgi:hypothetical protein